MKRKIQPKGSHKVCEFKNKTQLSFENTQNTSGIFRLTSNQLLPVAFMMSIEVYNNNNFMTQFMFFFSFFFF